MEHLNHRLGRDTYPSGGLLGFVSGDRKKTSTEITSPTVYSRDLNQAIFRFVNALDYFDAVKLLSPYPTYVKWANMTLDLQTNQIIHNLPIFGFYCAFITGSMVPELM